MLLQFFGMVFTSYPLITYGLAYTNEAYAIDGLLSKIAAPRIKRADLRSFTSDGVVVLRDVIPDVRILDGIRLEIEHSNLDANWQFLCNLRKLVKDGPMGAIAALLLGAASVRISNTAYFTHNSVEFWHPDVRMPPGTLTPVLTVWLALTDAPDALSFILGSHTKQYCQHGYFGPHGFDPRLPHAVCVRSLESNLTRDLMRPSRVDVGCKAGDVIAFHAGIYHRSNGCTPERLCNRNRAAVALRFVTSNESFFRNVHYMPTHRFFVNDLPRDGELHGGPVFPIVYPKGYFELDAPEWPARISDAGARAAVEKWWQKGGL